jgi:hypothetical protein
VTLKNLHSEYSDTESVAKSESAAVKIRPTHPSSDFRNQLTQTTNQRLLALNMNLLLDQKDLKSSNPFHNNA